MAFSFENSQVSRRSECACLKCQAPCHDMPGHLVPSDIPVMMAAVGESDPVEFAEKYLQASDGAKLLDRETNRSMRIPTLVPRLIATGCIWFRGGKCEIHQVSPHGCRDYKVCEDEPQAEVNRRMLRGLRAAQSDKLYAGLVRHLQEIGQTAPPLEQRRARFTQRLRRIMVDVVSRFSTSRRKVKSRLKKLRI